MNNILENNSPVTMESERIKDAIPVLRKLIEIATGEKTELILKSEEYIEFTLGSDTGKIRIRGDNALKMIKDVLNRI